MPLHRRTADDRAKEVPLCGVTGDPTRWTHSGNVPPDTQRRIALRTRAMARARSKSRPTAALIYVLFLFAIVYTLEGLVHNVWSPWPNEASIAAAIGIGGIMAFALYRKLRSSARTHCTVAAFLIERRCPACGYDLTGSEPESDGCTVCPECGAAWRMPAPVPSASTSHPDVPSA